MQSEQIQECLRKIEENLSKEFLPDPESFIEAQQKAAPVSLRLHPRKAGDIAYQEAEPVAWNSHGRYLQDRPSFTMDPLFHAGAYYVQEASSMSIEAALKDLFPSERELTVLDLCAAPGGKSTLLASFLNGNGVLVCNEVIRSRAQILKENIDKWGYANVLVSNNDPRDFKKLPGVFDVIVCDAPCSGSGMFRKDPKTANHWSPEAVVHCAARQSRIIEDCWPALKEGGVLIYSTCSYSEEENEHQIKNLIEQSECELVFPGALENIQGVVKTSEGFRFYPHRLKGEGFFISIVRKTSPNRELFYFNKRIQFLPLHSDAEQLLENPEQFVIWQGKTARHIFPAEQADEMASLAPILYLLKAGIEEGETKGDKLIPSQELALSVNLRQNINHIDLSENDALKYLRKEALPNPFGACGFTLMKYQNLPLGWGNALPNRINNLLPKSWRIRKDIDSLIG